MKKLILYTIIIGLSYSTYGQKLTRNEIDEFTGNMLKQTSWEKFVYDRKTGLYSFARTLSIDGEYFLNLKIMIGNGIRTKVFSISENDLLMIKMKDGEIIKLPNIKYSITCNGCGAVGISGSNAEGINVTYSMTKDQFNTLKNNDAVKIRLNTSETFREGEMNLKNYKKLQKALSLIE